jgi:hypothetical protein
MITLTDAYCRVNRARGLDLVSPEDLLNACNNFGRDNDIPLTLHNFETTGVSVIQLVRLNLPTLGANPTTFEFMYNYVQYHRGSRLERFCE